MLRIENYLLPSERQIQLIDYTIECEEPLVDKPEHVKGVLTAVNYYGLKDELVVKESISDIVENGEFVGIATKIDWYDTEGNVGITRTICHRMDIVGRFEYLIDKRRREISYLQAYSVGTPIEQYVLTLLKHYKNEVELFIQNGAVDFQNAINAETDSAILSILNKKVNKQGDTVKDTILDQIT